MSSLYWYHGTETVVGDTTTVSSTNIVTEYTPHQMVVKALLNTFLGHYRIWCILLFQLSVCHAKPHVWQSSKHLKKMAEKIKKKYKIFFQFLQKETICMRKKQAAMAVVVAEGVRNGKISARHILRFKGQKSTFFNSLHWPYALQGCPVQHFLNDIDSCLLWAKRYTFLKNRAFFGF